MDVSAAGDTRVYGLPVNLAFGTLTLGAGLDVGIIDNDTTARINSGAVVRALQDIDVHAVTHIEGDSFVANFGQPSIAGLNMSASLWSIRGKFDSAMVIPLGSTLAKLGVSLPDIPLLNTVSADSIMQKIDGLVSDLTSNGGGGLIDALGGYKQGPANEIAASLGTGTPHDIITSSVGGNFDSTGTTAIVDGAMLVAGRNVSVRADERTDLAADTSSAVDLMYAIATPNPALAAIYMDRAVFTVNNIAVASVTGGANLTAGQDVVVRGHVENDQTITASTGAHSIIGTVGAGVDGSTIVATAGDVNVSADTDVFSTVWSVYPRFDGLQIKDGTNSIAILTEARVGGGSNIAAASDVNVTANDRTVALAVGNAMTLGKKGPLSGVVPAMGIAMATNTIQNTVRAAVEASSLTAQTGSVQVHADSTPVTVAIGLGIVQASQWAVLGGTYATNATENTVEAIVSNNSTLNSPIQVLINAEDNGTIVVVGGNVAVAKVPRRSVRPSR